MTVPYKTVINVFLFNMRFERLCGQKFKYIL